MPLMSVITTFMVPQMRTMRWFVSRSDRRSQTERGALESAGICRFRGMVAIIISEKARLGRRVLSKNAEARPLLKGASFRRHRVNCLLSIPETMPTSKAVDTGRSTALSLTHFCESQQLL